MYTFVGENPSNPPLLFPFGAEDRWRPGYSDPTQRYSESVEIHCSGNDLSDLIGVKVDLVRKGSFEPNSGQEVLHEAIPVEDGLE